MFLLSVSSLLEGYTRERTSAVLTESLAVKIDKVWLINGETEVLIPISDLKVGDCIRVRTGSMIPVDGEIIDGEAYVNESSMTGEPLAVMKSSGDTVFAGTVVEEGTVVTGDSQKAAMITAARLGITEYHAQVLPEDKHRMMEEIKSRGHRTIMVGDGINDAPALAAANVSVAMSDASDIAREVADITLRGSDLTELAVFRELSERLMDRINRNYRFIVGFNSALLLSGLFGILTPSLSALLHNASTMAICAKSMLPLLKEDREKE